MSRNKNAELENTVTASNRLKQRSMDFIKRQLGLPEHAVFLGYVVQVNNMDFIKDIIDSAFASLLISVQKCTRSLRDLRAEVHHP